MRFIALLLLLSPALFITYWHLFHWGGALGRAHWTAGRMAGLLLLSGYAVWVLLVDGAVLGVLLGSGARRGGQVPLLAFVMPGIGAGIAMFPQAAASLSPWYAKLAQWQMTKDFAVLGWGLILVSALVVGGVVMALG